MTSTTTLFGRVRSAPTSRTERDGLEELDDSHLIPPPQIPKVTTMSPPNPVMTDDSPDGGILVNRLRPSTSPPNADLSKDDQTVMKKVKGVLGLRRGSSSSGAPLQDCSPGRLEKTSSALEQKSQRGRSDQVTSPGPRQTSESPFRDVLGSRLVPDKSHSRTGSRTSIPEEESQLASLRVKFAPLPDPNRQRSASMSLGVAARAGMLRSQGSSQDKSMMSESTVQDDRDPFRAKDAVKFGKRWLSKGLRRGSTQDDSGDISTSGKDEDAHRDMARERNELSAAGLTLKGHPDHPDLQSHPTPILMPPQSYPSSPLRHSQSSNAVPRSKGEISGHSATIAGSTFVTGRRIRLTESGMKQYLDDSGKVTREESVNNPLSRRKSTGGMTGSPANRTSLENERRGDLFVDMGGSEVMDHLNDELSDDGEITDATNPQDDQELWEMEEESSPEPKKSSSLSGPLLPRSRNVRSPQKARSDSNADKVLERERYNEWRRGRVPPSADSKRLVGRVRANLAGSSTPGISRDDWNDMSPESSESGDERGSSKSKQVDEHLDVGKKAIDIKSSPNRTANQVDSDDDPDWPSSLHL